MGRGPRAIDPCRRGEFGALSRILDFGAQDFHIPDRLELFKIQCRARARCFGAMFWQVRLPAGRRARFLAWRMGRNARVFDRGGGAGIETRIVEQGSRRPMELNTKGRYAVMAMADLAQHTVRGQAENPAKPLSEIAERQQISLPYLEQLFQRLRKAGLVDSVRGRAGGYALSRAAGDIRIAAILAAVEEPVRMTRCMGGEEGCVGHERCLTHDLWSALGDHIAAFLDGVTLRDVLEGMPGQRHVGRLRTTSPAPLDLAAE